MVPGKKDAPIRIVQRKSKDAELAPHVCVQLQGVYIPGWFDDEGEQISSAVPVITECDSDEAKDEHDKALVGHIRMIQEAWRSTGEELFEGSPYITKSALLSFLINNKGLSESSAKQYVKPSQGKRLIGNLINNDIAKEALNGFVIVEPAMVSQLMVGRSGN